MEAPSLPRSEADLDGWHVYADWLAERGDPRAEAIALELSLPARPSTDELARFHDATRRLARMRTTTPIGWCLGHARTLTLGDAYLGIESGTLVSCADFLSTPIAARLETSSSRCARIASTVSPGGA
jgi:uncharacterized protein (TIGR02996 family)